MNSNSSPFPYFDPGILYDKSPFRDSYDYLGGDHYWNGKYNSLDILGNPKGIEDIRQGLDTIRTDELETFLTDRAKKVSYYQETIAANKNNAALYKTEIDKIIKNHRLK